MTGHRLCTLDPRLLGPGRVRRILALAGWFPRPGLPAAGATLGILGSDAAAVRRAAQARAKGARIVQIEPALLCPPPRGRVAAAPAGLIVGALRGADRPGHGSALLTCLETAPLDDPARLARAAALRQRWRSMGFGCSAAVDPGLGPPAPGYVLIGCGPRQAPEQTQAMMAAARAGHPGARIVLHDPTVALGQSPVPGTAGAGPEQVTGPVSPWALIDGARAIYTMDAPLGFEAICAGRRPVVFGAPFYAGWGLTEDRGPVPHRSRSLTADQLFAAAMIDMTVWYDPHRNRLCGFETALDALEAQARAWAEDRHGHVAAGMPLWKWRHLRRFFGGQGVGLRFRRDAAGAKALARRRGAGVLVWGATGSRADTLPGDVPVRRLEDGFLRSRGLGVALVPPLSLALDDLGIYYDATRPSRLERLIDASRDLPADALARAARLRERLIAEGLTKYNLGGGAGLPDTGGRPVVMVAGQVADDASIRLGCGPVDTNAALLAAARVANPGAFLVYKPHPDVEAGLRRGALSEAEAAAADHVARGADPMALIGRAASVWTLTSLLGFEALLRGVKVTCLGAPFYAGWGLTQDLGPVPGRRRPGVPLDGLIHAALIAYPRYCDPVTGLPCPAEVAIDRLASGLVDRGGPLLRLMAAARRGLARRP